ncbi:MAG: cation-translocating P-type ATPase [Bryobacteraceae bacterium]
MAPFGEEQFRGLSEQEARARLGQSGYNELPSSKPRGIFRIAFEMLQEPMLLLLVAAGVIYFILGDLREAAVLCAFVGVVIGIDLYQKRKTERALDALRDLSSPRALVVRDGVRRRIAGREVVDGDIFILGEGDRVPADALLLSATNLTIDESLLTGESVPVRKLADVANGSVAHPGGDDLPYVYSGSLVVHGSGIARVTKTGIRTELGKIGATLQSVPKEPTLLEQDTARLVRGVATVGVTLCALFLVIYGVTRGDWLHGFLAALAMAMSVLPEELPVVLTVFLALGARRLSRVNVLTRTNPAIETLGSTTVLCVDKTGTLTQNQMAVARLYANTLTLEIPSAAASLGEEWHDLTEFAVLASHSDALDPMDRAIRRLGDDALSGTEHLHGDWSLVKQYPLASQLLAISQVWKSPSGEDYVIAAKGAPEAIIELCHMPDASAREILSAASAFASDGLRVLGVAKSRFRPAELPSNQHDFVFEFVGLIALADPVRPAVPAAVRECQDAGIRVVMITGDYPATAMSIAKQIGLDTGGSAQGTHVLTGTQIRDASPQQLQEMAANVSVFARAVPEQKLFLVNALKARGEVVAMTGDGVNDAPALKAAHIGIAMGARGTDVAREASDLVLLDDDFTSIVAAVRLGRRIFDNLKKATSYVLAIHVPIAGLSFLPVLFGWPVILGPVQIAFLELIIDPACSIAFEAEEEEPGIMRRPPRASTDRLYERRLILLSLLQGFGILLILLGVFALNFYRGHGEEDARALTFTSLVVTNLVLIIANRSWSRSFGELLRTPNRALWIIVVGALVVLTGVLYIPFLRDLFHFSTPHLDDIALCLGAGAMAAVWFELLKFVYGKRSA